MSELKDSERIKALRERLYARGGAPETAKKRGLSDRPVEVRRNWNDAVPAKQPEARPADPRMSYVDDPDTIYEEPAPEPEQIPEDLVEEKPTRVSRSYRLIVLLIAIFGFIVVAGLSSVYLFFGGNQISGRNIEVSMSGPFSLSGGEVLPLQVGVTNQNTVPIESVTLILNYPPGTRSVGEEPRDLYEERIQLDDIAPGEALNVPIRVTVFGEESEEKSVEATIEYRLQNSNGTFYKDAEPHTFQMKSAALVIGVESVETVASGQEIDVTLNVRSNSPSTLENVLVTADYPDGFDFTSSSPEPVYGQNSWLIEELEPEATERITLRGVIIGLIEEESVINFEAGNPRVDNQFIMGTVLARGDASFFIERPFIDVGLEVSGRSGEEVVLPYGRSPSVNVTVQNTLIDPIFDMVVEVSVSGNVINERTIDVSNGFYNSVDDVVRWDVSSYDALEEVPAGSNRRLSFNIEPNAIENTASLQVEANVYARRVLDDQVTEELIGFAETEAKFTSSVNASGMVGRNSASFSESGPVPPVAEEETTYTITLSATAGANDMTNAELITSIPQYVEWLDAVEGYGDIAYNPVSKRITWDIGDIEAEESVEIAFQVSLLPSLNQIGRTPALLGEQQLRATDRFTGAVVRDSSPPLNTEMSENSGFEEGNGQVQDN